MATFCELCGQEVLGLDLVAGDPLDVREDDLQGPLEDLDLPPDVEEVAGLEGPGQPLAGVPEPGPDGAGLVPELQVEIEVPLAVGPELLVGDEEDLVDRIPVGELIDETTGHARGPIIGARRGRGESGDSAHEARL